MNAERKSMQELHNFQTMTNLRSNFFDFLSLVNSTKHFKKHTGGLVSFTKLCSGKEYQKQTSKS